MTTNTVAAAEKLFHRAALQYELLSGEPGSYVRARAQAEEDLYGFLAKALDQDWSIELGHWVVYSESEEGYWNHCFGWVGDRDSATGYADEKGAKHAAMCCMCADAQVRHEP